MEIEKIGRYEILSELGQGAMGVVYKAIDPLIDRTVAIKTINLNLSRDELTDFEERFNREAKSAGRLNHPNIVTIYDVGRVDHIAYITMEYLEGRELKEIVNSGEPLPPERIAEIIAQVADGLAFAHDNGIVHRDIKPANIMVLRNGNVKITDFGIAKMSSGSRTQIGIILGSPKYMSPEQVTGKYVDGRSDIFSLGVVLYELLTGKPAFGNSDSTLTTIMFQILNETPAPPTKGNPFIPATFDHIVARALAKEPENRYQSAREMANDLRNFKNLTATAPAGSRKKCLASDGDATLVLDASKVKIPSRWHKWKKLFGGAIAATLIVLIALFFNANRKPIATSAIEKIPMSVPNAPDRSRTPKPAASAPAHKQSQPVIAERKPVEASGGKHENQKSVTPTIGSLSFSILPWGEVFIDGKSRGASPPFKEVQLPLGKHQIEIKNSNFPIYRRTVIIKAGASQKIQHKFK